MWLLSISYLVFIHNLGSIGLIDETEPKFAEAARQMLVRQDWISPYFNLEPRFDKPPLVYWLMAMGYKILGVNEWAVRLPSALGAIALMGLLFYTLRHYASVPNVREKWFCALLGSALLAFNPQAIVWGRIGVSDMLLTGCMGSALLAFFLGYAAGDGAEGSTPPSQPWYLAFYILTSLAVLTKGPVGVVLPAIVISCFLLYVGQFWQVLREMRPLRGILIVLAIILPWYVLMTVANGQAFIESFFGYHNFERFTRVVNRHAAPWYFYVPIVLVAFAPWSVYLPVAIARLQVWRRHYWRRQPRTQQLGLFALFWFGGIFGFFTLASTKLPSYTLPLIPAAAILVSLQFGADFFQPTPKSQFPRLTALSRGFNVGVFLLFSIALFTLPNWLGYDPAAPDLDEELQRTGIAVVAAAIWFAAAVLAGRLLLARKGRWLWAANLVTFIAFLIFTVHPIYLLVDGQRQLPLRQLAAIIPQVRQPSEELVMIDLSKTSLVFYSQQPIVFRIRPESASAYIQELMATQPEIDTVLILGQRSKIKQLGIGAHQYRTLGQVRSYQLVRVAKRLAIGDGIEN